MQGKMWNYKVSTIGYIFSIGKRCSLNKTPSEVGSDVFGLPWIHQQGQITPSRQLPLLISEQSVASTTFSLVSEQTVAYAPVRSIPEQTVASALVLFCFLLISEQTVTHTHPE